MKCLECGSSKLKKLNTTPQKFRGEIFLGYECQCCKKRQTLKKPKRKPRTKKEPVDGPNSNNQSTDS